MLYYKKIEGDEEMKRILSAVLAVCMALCLLGCTREKDTRVKVYTVEEKFNSATVNQWKTLYLLDEDTYTLTVYALDSQDGKTVTADFYMTGKYTTNENGTITLQSGYGYAEMMNGDIPVEMQVAPDANGGLSNLYYSMIGQFDTFILNDDGTWTGA